MLYTSLNFTVKNSMKLTIEDIDHIATLARLTLTEEEKSRYAEQLSAVLGYVDMLNEVHTDDVPETCQVTGLENITREDTVIDCDEETKEKLRNQFPDNVGNLLKVKAVFDNA